MNADNENDLPVLKTLPGFYREIIENYNGAKTIKIPVLKKQLLEQCLWGNKLLKATSCNRTTVCLYSKNWIQAGFVKVKDVFHNNGELKTDIYETLKKKTDYYSTCTKIMKSVKRFKHLFLLEDVSNENICHEYDQHRKILAFQSKDEI